METNTLVTIKNKPDFGICCISKIFAKHYNVNIGTDGCEKIVKEKCLPIDVKNCKTITFNQFRSRILSDNSTLNDVIVGNELKHYVGIGWVTERVIDYEDLCKYPRVI
jgi:hypothetical protein